MSDQPDRQSVSSFEEEEEVFLDMDDENNVVVDDGSGPEPNQDQGDSDNDIPEDEEKEEEDGDQPIFEPERDDSIATFIAVKPLHSIATNPKKTTIAVGSEDDNVFACDVDLMKPAESFGDAGTSNLLVTMLQGHSDTIISVAYSPNGTQLATAGMDCVVNLWDITQEGMPLAHKLADLSGEVNKILWHPTGMALVACASDAQAAMWNSSKGTLAQYFVGHRDAVTCVSWSEDVKKLITAGADSTVIMFNPKTGEAEKTISKDVSAGITTLQVVGGDKAVVGCEDGGIQLISLSAGRVVSQMNETHEQAIEAMALCEVQPLLAACSCDCQVSVWSTQDWTCRSLFKFSDGLTRVIWVGPMVIASSCNARVVMWDGRQHDQEPVRELLGHRAAIMDLVSFTAENADGQPSQYLATAGDDCCMKVFAMPN